MRKFRSNEFKFNKNYDGGRPMLGFFFTETTGRPIVQEHLFMLTAINLADIDSLELLGKVMSPDVLQLPFIL